MPQVESYADAKVLPQVSSSVGDGAVGHKVESYGAASTVPKVEDSGDASVDSFAAFEPRTSESGRA